MNKYTQEKACFAEKLSEFAKNLGSYITENGEWTIKGFIDVFKNIYTISTDTKIVSKVLEIHLFPYFLAFAESNGYELILATHQNWYPDMTFVSKSNSEIKFAVDLKTTYKDEKKEGYCNGFTLGSHGEYFINRKSSKNIQYPYEEYSGHFCLGIIYERGELDKKEELKRYTIEQLKEIPTAIKNFIFFAQEKWRIASDKGGSGNTANIGSIKNINDILSGNGTFAKAGEEIFDDYWANFGKIQLINKKGERKNLSSFEEYIEDRGLNPNIKNEQMATREE